MKKILLFISLFAYCNIIAIAQVKVIGINHSKLTQIILDKEIEKYKGGFDPSMFSLEHYKNVLYIQPLVKVDDSNLSIITTDGLIYIATLHYKDSLETMTYNLTSIDAVNYKSENIKLEKHTTTTTIRSDTTNNEDQKLLKLIALKPQFIYNSNGIETRSFSLYVKGIYATNEHLYFQIDLMNKTYIPYNCDLITFGSRTKRKGKTISDQRAEFPIVDKFYPKQDLSLGKQTLVYKLPKFSLSRDKEFTIELIEQQGERNIFCVLHYDFILQARPLALD